ncbi:MAG: Appr-1-p processing protein [Chloroflexaceae bacterium]|nr:Appr-1-p processing protein [Chloroflexaceae bacterium]
MHISTVTGDLLEQLTEAIVNPWNQNVLPWWLLLPHGVSGAIKRRAGVAPFQELARAGRLAPGHAVVTSAGRLPYRAIIHVASIHLWGRSSAQMIDLSVKHALEAAENRPVRSLAFPLLGTGAGGFDTEASEKRMFEILSTRMSDLAVVLVRYDG